MTDYLAMLANLDFPKTPHKGTVLTAKSPLDFSKTLPNSTALTAKRPYGSFDSDHREHISENEPVTKPEPDQPQTAEIWVVGWTPAGNPLRVRARDAAHAAWIQRMNPPPEAKAKP